MTVATPPQWAAELIELLDAQRAIYRQLQQLSDRQGRIVSDGEPDMSALVTLLSQRQELIDQLTGLTSRIEPFRSNWVALWNSLDAVTRTQVRALIDEVQALLDAIVEQDERDRASLSDRRDRVAGQIAQVKRGSVVNKAYGPSAVRPANPRFTDEQG